MFPLPSQKKLIKNYLKRQKYIRFNPELRSPKPLTLLDHNMSINKLNSLNPCEFFFKFQNYGVNCNTKFNPPDTPFSPFIDNTIYYNLYRLLIFVF